MPKLAGVNHLDAVRALAKAGFSIARQGKHIVMTDGTRVLSIPRHNPVNAITMGNISGMRGSRTMSSAYFSERKRRTMPSTGAAKLRGLMWRIYRRRPGDR